MHNVLLERIQIVVGTLFDKIKLTLLIAGQIVFKTGTNSVIAGQVWFVSRVSLFLREDDVNFADNMFLCNNGNVAIGWLATIIKKELCGKICIFEK